MDIYTDSKDLLQAVVDFLEKTKMTNTDLAKEIGYSRTAVSQYLSGKYASNPFEIELALRRFLDENKVAVKKVVDKFEQNFFITNDVGQMMAVCQSCQENKGLGIIVGRSGYGKTATLKEYAQLDRVCYVECDDSMGSRDLVEAIEAAIGIPSGYGSIWKRVKGIKEFFNINCGYLLIIDEADKLVTKYTQKKIEILRTIFDQSNVGLVVAGEPKLESLIKGYITRFANRVDFFISLKGLCREEVIEYLKPLNMTNQAREELIIRGTNSTTGCFRLLSRTIENVFRLSAPDDEITIDTIKKASKMMML